MELRLECPNCKFKYSPTPEDEGPHPDIGTGYGDNYQDKIFKRRYSQDSSGNDIECLICTSCHNISYVFVQKSFRNLLGVSSPYKVVIKPKRIAEIRTEANKIADISGEDVQSILEGEFHITSNIFNVLSSIHQLTIGELGLKHFDEYCGHILRSVGYFSSEKYSMEEMREKYDINDRLEEIAKNKAT